MSDSGDGPKLTVITGGKTASDSTENSSVDLELASRQVCVKFERELAWFSMNPHQAVDFVSKILILASEANRGTGQTLNLVIPRAFRQAGTLFTQDPTR